MSALSGVLALGSGLLTDEAHGAHQAIIPVLSPTNNGPADAFGALRPSTLYTGALVGADIEDWLQYWHVPRWDGTMAFRSDCATLVELHATANDTLTPATLLSEVEVGPAGARQAYQTPEAVVRRMLVRVVRTDGGTEPCGWYVDTQASRGFADEPSTPTVTLRAERKDGRTVAVVVTARIQPRSRPTRPTTLEISGAVRRTIRASVPTSGTIVRRIPLPAGRKGTFRVTVSAPATITRAVLPAATSTLRVASARPVVRRPIVRRPAPPPRRPVVRKPKGPLTKVPAGIFNVVEGLRVRPGSINAGTSLCSFYFTDIRWSSWTSTQARGSGKLHIPQLTEKTLSCPDARKNRTITPTTIRLLNPRVCSGERIFSRITWTHKGRVGKLDIAGCY